MSLPWANEFREILPTLQQRPDLCERIDALIQQDMAGRVTEGSDRLVRFRVILGDLVGGRISLDEAYRATARELPRRTSPHTSNNRVFADGWEERLVRTQLSRLYNQSVLEFMRESGQSRCLVPHSTEEEATSPCTRLLAGREQAIEPLYQRLVESYTHGRWTNDVKIPEHPHCTHVVRPLPEAE